MAFGYHKAKREQEEVQKLRKRLAREREALDQDRGIYDERLKQQATDLAQQYRQDREAGRQRGSEYGERFLNRDMQGLTPTQKIALQEGGKRRINRETQGMNRQLLGNLGARGIKGGAAYAQKADLARAGQEAQQQYMKDIDLLDQDVALKKLGALFGIEQGEAAQSQLDRQLATDTLRMEDERKKQRTYEDYYNDLFSRI